MRAAFAVVTVLAAATVSAFFDGPCNATACAAPGRETLDCEFEGMVCVPFPKVSVEERLGCACSMG
ncbi:hypothetical protein CTA1_1627 [Colletotrichum tanaceti]|uniref:Extracellular membrane protein CFEM domain-containing protein n=1 Tax=Colletotrichum tanaceti TaxID=1306861 RepID=A0A4U6WYV2_9PEZI|nr:hypothetical protein CTA1_1627 [Colletotrichum tanaceti]